MSTTVRAIRANYGWGKGTPDVVLGVLHAVITGLTNNPNFPNPPVPLADLSTAATALPALIAAAQDGSKKAIAERNKQMAIIVKQLKLLARWVEATCKDDIAIFASSGFQAASTTRTAAQPLSQPAIEKVDQGLTGQLLVSVTPRRKALSYELRFGAENKGGPPSSWITATLTTARGRKPVNGLTPGTVYAFQVRALGKLGHTDWSDSVTRMCI
jgi:hypothetical protein